MEEGIPNIVLAGGGTGGHLYPALSVAAELERRLPGVAIAFIGARRGLESRVVPQEGYPLLALRLSGLKGKGLVARATGAATAAWAVARCALWMLRRRPNLVIGVGGYASGPAVLAASLIGVKTMILEQNHFPGATNRWLAPRVGAVCLPSEQARAHIGGRTFVTGNPVRSAFVGIGEPPDGECLSLLVFGGSRGAHSINRALTGALEQLARINPAPRIVHQTGEADLDEVRTAYERHYPTDDLEVRSFLDDMPRRLAEADLVVCRSGASSVSELAAAGRPAILVPYPWAADDHQRHNAESLERAGAAVVIADRELAPLRIAREIARLAGDRELRERMARAARSLARPDAAGEIVTIAERLMQGQLEHTDVS